MSAEGVPPHSTATSTSGDTIIGDLENHRQNLNSSNPRGNSSIGHGVDVAAAEADFHELSRQLSGLSRTASRHSRRLSRSQSKTGDPEKSGPVEEEEEQFDLEDHLRGAESDERAAGIRPKKIGKFSNSLSQFQI